jgi:ankyrin repeat protein
MDYGVAPLHYAIGEKLNQDPEIAIKNLENVKLLVNAGANVNARISNGISPLIMAVGVNHQELAEFLMVAGANVNARSKVGISAVAMAVRHNNQEMVELLIAAGAYVDALVFEKVTALALAVKMQNIEIVAILISAGADVDKQMNEPTEEFAFVALHFAVDGESPEIVEALLKGGANAKIKDDIGSTPWDRAVGNPKIEGSKAYWALHDAQFD